MHATGKMGFPSNCGVESYDKKTNKVNIFSSPQPKQRKKLGSILKLEEYEGDSHPQAVKDAEKFRVFHQKQNAERKPCKSEEVVRYMSCLPNYLERGENPKEKPFNIGVLDWSQLEKWQHNTADVFGINADPSTSTSNSTSLNFSKVSSSNLSNDNTLSHHRNLSRPSTSNVGLSKFVSRSGGELPEQRKDPINLLRVQQNLLQATQSSKSFQRSRPSETDNAISGFKGNGTQRKEQTSKTRDQVPFSAMTDLDYSEICKTRRFVACHHQSDSSEGNKNGLLEENQFHGRPDAKVSCDKSIPEDNLCSSAVRDSRVDKSFTQVRSLNCSSGQEQTIACTQSVSIGPSRRKNAEKKNSDSKPRNLACDEILQAKVDTSESTKIRNRRFSFGISRIGKTSNSNSSEVLPDSKLTSTSACSNSRSGGKSNATSRARSSPLRMLLDPLLKPKSGESCEFARSSSRERSSKPSRVQIESPALLPAKETVDSKSFRSHHTQKNGASSKQALLQIAVKNGLPLFTFTVDNCRDILAATVKELSSKENMGGWIYTFFSFTEMKKKHIQWINQGSKDKNHGFVSNIVAIMKVSDVFESDSNGRGLERSTRREFALSAVGPREADLTADTLPCNELAAIVVKYPRVDCEQGNECGSEIPFSTTVILPGGHHGVPIKGEPSPLIKRWKTGESCDCGGWDLGCQLTILSSSNSIKSESTAVKLFSQVIKLVFLIKFF